MTAHPSLWTRVRHALFGKPVTPEEARARRAAEAAAGRSTASFENGARGRSVQNQTYYF